MDSKWEKMNPLLFQKIKEYDRQQTEDQYEIAEFQNSQNKLFLQIQQNALKHKNTYVFPRKIQQNQKMVVKDDTQLASEFSGKKYNLYQQNTYNGTNRQTRLPSCKIGKPMSKNQFVVRKNLGIELPKNKQKRLSSENNRQCESGSVSRLQRKSHGNGITGRVKENQHVVPLINIIRTKLTSKTKQVQTPKTLKKQSMLFRNDSQNSFNSCKQNRKQHIQSNSGVRTALKSKFNESPKEAKIFPRLFTDYTDN